MQNGSAACLLQEERPTILGGDLSACQGTMLDTKLLIANSFVTLCENTPLRKVSVTDIVEKANINRKTFYYHFLDKDNLTAWVFRYEIGKALSRRFPERNLVYETSLDSELSRLPYYICIQKDFRSLDHAPFFECFVEVLANRQAFYRQALDETGPHALRNYLYDLYMPAVRHDIILILSSLALPEEDITFLAEFYTCAFLYYFLRKINSLDSEAFRKTPKVFGNIVHTSLEMEVKRVLLERNL